MSEGATVPKSEMCSNRTFMELKYAPEMRAYNAGAF